MKLIIPFETKQLSDNGYISGYASVFNVVDHQKDVVRKGAFQENIEQWQKKQKWPKMLWNHEPTEPIGIWTKMIEDQKGLYVEGKILKELSRGHEIYTLLKNGAIDGLSIGYVTKESQFNKHTHSRELIKLDLYEVSFVTFAANPEAQIIDIKNQDLFHLAKELRLATQALKQYF